MAATLGHASQQEKGALGRQGGNRSLCNQSQAGLLSRNSWCMTAFDGFVMEAFAATDGFEAFVPTEGGWYGFVGGLVEQGQPGVPA